MHGLRAVWSLTERELVRFVRQRSRAIGAFLQPVIFWVLFGAGFRRSFQLPGLSEGPGYAEFFLPGIAAMIVMFTAIFSAISVIQDRNEGVLQGVLVSPISRTSIVLGKLCGGMLLAVMQGLLFLGLAWVLQFTGLVPGMTWRSYGGLVRGHRRIPVSDGFCSVRTRLRVCLAAGFDSGIHAIMSVLLFPMWLLSGAFFPPREADGWSGS